MSIGRDDVRFKIIQARAGHLDDIVELADMYSLSGLTREMASERGFFVSHFSRDSYREFMVSDNVFWLLLQNGKTRGFLLALDPGLRILDDVLHKRIVASEMADYILIKQVCTHPDHTSRGIASHLYKAFIEEFGDRPIVAAIVEDPPNPRSVAFHERWGFQHAFDHDAPDGLPRSIWIRAKGRWNR